MSPSVMNEPINELKSSGAEVPIAMNVAPATSAERPRSEAITMGHDK